MNKDYKRGYSKGYIAGRYNKWPEFMPPSPPMEQVAELFSAAKELRDAAIGVVQVIDCDTEPFIELRDKVYALEDQLQKISEWIKSNL